MRTLHPERTDLSPAEIERVELFLALVDCADAVELSGTDGKIITAARRWTSRPRQIRSQPRPRPRGAGRPGHRRAREARGPPEDDEPPAATSDAKLEPTCPDPLVCEHRNRHPNGPWTCEYNHPAGSKVAS